MATKIRLAALERAADKRRQGSDWGAILLQLCGPESYRIHQAAQGFSHDAVIAAITYGQTHWKDLYELGKANDGNR